MVLLAYVLHVGVFPTTEYIAWHILYEMAFETATLWGFIVYGTIYRRVR